VSVSYCDDEANDDDDDDDRDDHDDHDHDEILLYQYCEEGDWKEEKKEQEERRE